MTLTTDEIKLLLENFATKYDLERVKEELHSEMVTKVEFTQALGKLDYIIGELQTIRQELVFGGQRFEDLEEDVSSSLKKRVKKIEDVPAVSSHLK